MNGKLGTMTSSARFKDHIKPMDNASESIFALKPVRFRYKNHIDAKATRRFGLVAEEVEAINPDLVVRDKEGKAFRELYQCLPDWIRFPQFSSNYFTMLSVS